MKNKDEGQKSSIPVGQTRINVKQEKRKQRNRKEEEDEEGWRGGGRGEEAKEGEEGGGGGGGKKTKIRRGFVEEMRMEMNKSIVGLARYGNVHLEKRKENVSLGQ